jgi:hypothetical protein
VRSRGFVSAVSAAVVALIACSFPAQVSMPPTETGGSAPTGSGASQPGQPRVPPWPLKDMSVRPQIWFGPMDPPEWSTANPGVEGYDYMQLFDPLAPWPRTAEAVRVMVLFPVWLDGGVSDSQLEMVINNLRARRIGVAFESGQLTEHGACNAGTIEGFNGVPGVSRVAERIQSAGGVLYAYAMEHGFDAASYYDPACRMTPQKIAADSAKTAAAVHALFPEAIIGSIETANLEPDTVAEWLDAYQRAAGEPLGFFNLDVNFNISDWAERARKIQDLVQARGIDFGIYYIGDPADPTEEAWYDHARDRMVEFEVVRGGRPDYALFQSWNPHPWKLLPEDQPGTYTHFVASYLRPRSRLSLQISQGVATGVLALEDGSPVANATVELSARPVTGEGVYADYTLTGVVPEAMTHADVGVRINTECSCSGPANLIVGSASYIEQGQGASQIPNGRFTSGMQGWGAWGAGHTELTRGENGSGQALLMAAAAGQDIGLNSGDFVVHPGQTFDLTFRARVDPPTNGSGYFAVFFLSDAGEGQRFILPFAVASSPVGTATTHDDGTFSLLLKGLPAGTTSVQAWYGGDDQVWPGAASTEYTP